MRSSRFGLVGLLLIVAGCGATPERGIGSKATTSSEIESLISPNAFSERAWLVDLSRQGLIDEEVWVRGPQVYVQARATGDAKSDERTIVALNVDDGSIRWILSLPSKVTAVPTIGSGNVAFTCGGSAVVVNARTGSRPSVKPQYDFDFYASGASAVSGDSLYVPSYLENRVEAVSLKTGLSGWNYQCADLVLAQPVICGDDAGRALVIAANNGEVSAVSLRSASGSAPSKRLWSRMISGSNVVSPQVSKDILYLPAGDTFLYAINGLSGSVLWKCPCESAFIGPLALAGDGLYIETKTGFVAVDANTGIERWRVPGISRFLADLGDRIAVITREGSVSVRSKESGEEFQCLQTRGLKHFATNGSSAMMVAGDGDGTIVAMR